MRISFVFTPYHHKIFEENVRVVDEEFGCFPPINLCYAAAVAQRAGHDVQVTDANALGLTQEKTIQKIKDFGAHAVGFYLTTYMVRETLSWAKRIRGALELPILTGGICATLYPADVMTNCEVDFNMEGEAVRSLPMLLNAMEAGKSPTGIPGVWYRKGGEVLNTPPYEDFVPFDEYPFPLREQLPNDRYYSITSQRKNFTIILTQIGCPFRCTFCPIPQSKYRARSVENVLMEVEECYQRHHVREIDFFDAEFPASKKRVRAICEGLNKYSNLEWSCRSRVDTVNPDLLKEMYRAGCRKIYFGIESANQDALDGMHKDITLEAVRSTIKACRKSGIRPLGFFMVGVPGETKHTFKKTIQLALSLPLDYVQYSRMIPKPKTELDNELVLKTGRDYWSEYVRGEAGEERMPNIWSNVPEEELEQMTKIAYYRFYYRPKFAFQALMQMKSWEEIKRSIRVVMRMLIDYLRPELRKAPIYPVLIEPVRKCGASENANSHPAVTNIDN